MLYGQYDSSCLKFSHLCKALIEINIKIVTEALHDQPDLMPQNFPCKSFFTVKTHLCSISMQFGDGTNSQVPCLLISCSCLFMAYFHTSSSNASSKDFSSSLMKLAQILNIFIHLVSLAKIWSRFVHIFCASFSVAIFIIFFLHRFWL